MTLPTPLADPAGVLGVLLAGGKSARMGRDKGALVVGTDGDTLGALAARALRAVCGEVVCLGHGAGVPDDVPRVPDTPDDAPGTGPLAALAAGLPRLLAARPDVALVLVTPVDMPDVDAALLSRLLAARGDAAAACLAAEGALEPLPVVLTVAAARALVGAAGRGGVPGARRLGDALRALRPALLECGKIPDNLNDAGALAAWQRRRDV